MYQGVKGAPPHTWAASTGQEDNNVEVKLYWDETYGMLVQKMAKHYRIKGASCGMDGVNWKLNSDASTM